MPIIGYSEIMVCQMKILQLQMYVPAAILSYCLVIGQVMEKGAI